MADLSSQGATQAAILTPDARIAARVADRLTQARRVTGAELSSLTGTWMDAAVVCVSPSRDPPNWSRLIAATVTAHRPGVIVAVGRAKTALSKFEENEVLLVRRARNPQGGSLKLSELGGAEAVTVSHPAAPHPDDAEAAWPGEIAAACAAAGMPLAMLALLHKQSKEDEPEWRNLARQNSLAGRLGAALGGVWRRPAFAAEALGRFNAEWKALDELVDRLGQLVAMLTRPDEPPPRVEPPRSV